MKRRKQLFLLCIVVTISIAIFFVSGCIDQGFDFDEVRAARNMLTGDGYEVNNVWLNGTTAYVDMNASVAKDDKDNWWSWQVSLGMTTLSTVWEVDPNDLVDMSTEELNELGVTRDEVEYMSDEELAALSDQAGRRASNYVVIMRTPEKVCFYRLSRATMVAWQRAEDKMDDVESTQLYNKMKSEIKTSERCS